MKRITSLLVVGLALVLSCTKEGPVTINEITDLYTVPADATAMTFSDGESTWSTDRRYFDLSFGNTLETTLVGYDALLSPGQYILGGDEIGKAILAKTKVNGKTPQSGYITVNEKDGKYQFIARIDGIVYAWSGSLPFTPDPEPLKLTEVLLAQSNKPNGVNSLTMNLAQEGISSEFDMSTWQTVWHGEGKYLALDIFSNDGYLHDGTYRACAEGGVINTGEFGIGYDAEIQWGDQVYPNPNQGTCLWTVSGGSAVAEKKITDGIMKVSSEEVGDETIWTISWGVEYPVEIVFTGAIPSLTKPKREPDFKYSFKIGEPQAVSDAEGNVPEGVKKYPVTISNREGAVAAYLEFLMAEGSTELVEGSYPSTSYATQIGQLADGWDFMGFMQGGSYFINSAGDKVLLFSGQWTVKLVKLVTGAYEFIGIPVDTEAETFDIKASGDDYVEGSYSEGGDDEFDGVLLTKFANITDYTGWGMTMIALEFCTDGLTPTPGFFGATYSGDGNYLKLEIYATSTELAPGTYVPNEIGTDTVEEGQFKGGYDPAGGADYGTNWFTVTGGSGTSAHITDGTVTVTKDGDDYTILVESSAVKCKYVGPLHN